ncbi:MAG: hypothetical protein HQK75_19190 [Candidatus Magnetomorum sp.]|nr:hypothetical protein [Candidatus Magnetomorum sp.]
MIQSTSENNETPDCPEEEVSTPWHDYFGGLFKEALIPLNLDVESNYAIGKGPPKIDVLIIRKPGTRWTNDHLKFLPDAVRHTQCSHIILELKKTQSINIRSIWQSMGYLNRYLSLKNLKEKDVQVFLISSKTPRKTTLSKLDFVGTKFSGVYKSKNKLVSKLELICANDLSDAPHNVWIKFFASKQKEKSIALKRLFSMNYESFSRELKIIIFNIINYWHQTGEYLMETMKKDLSRKSYLNPNPGMLDFVKTFFPSSEIMNSYRPEERLSGLKPEERLSGLKPEEIFQAYPDKKELIRGLKPEERLSGLKPEERLSGLKPEERLNGLDRKIIEAYLELLLKKELGNGRPL